MDSPTLSARSSIDHLVIVAGGKGTRLAGVAANLPKVLVPIGGKPVLQHQLELAAGAGIRHVTIFAGHLADQISAFVMDQSHLELDVEVVVEEEPLGNAGAVISMLDRLPRHFYLVYGDVMLAVDLPAMATRHLDAAADFTAFVHPNDHPFDSDLIEANADGWVTAIHTYPHPDDRFFANRVNAALYVIRRDALRQLVLPVRCDFTKDVMPGLVAAGAKVLAYPSSEYIKDMGTPNRLERVSKDLSAGKLSLASAAKPAAAVFLDRDGTLNHDKGHLVSHDALELLHGAGEALRALRNGGYRLIVITNQPVIARGEATEADVEAIHRKLEWELGKAGAFVDGIYLCPHHPDCGFPGERRELKGPCACRKPALAMVEQACRDHRLDMSRSWVVGDQTADMELARRAGMKSILVQTGASGRDAKYEVAPDHVVADIGAAAKLILAAGEA